MRKHISTPPQASVEGPARKMSGRRVLLRGAVGAAAVATLTVGLAGNAFAATGGDTTDAHVEVTTAISMTATPNFTLTGIPGATVAGLGAVALNVATNSLAGYAVTVQSATATMTPTAGGNPDSIPIADLSVREGGATDYTPLSSTGPVTVHSQDTRSVEAGDILSNDYSVDIPFVNADTYNATLDYVATTL